MENIIYLYLINNYNKNSEEQEEEEKTHLIDLKGLNDQQFQTLNNHIQNLKNTITTNNSNHEIIYNHSITDNNSNNDETINNRNKKLHSIVQYL
ncbi:hypothetical protein ACTFIY_003165 [Dictyostelium cf. discoideum]